MPNILTHWAAIATLALASGVSVYAEEPGPSRKQMDDLLAEVREVRRLLEAKVTNPAQPTAQPVKVDVSTAPSLGSPDAPLAIVEVLDYQCRFCQQFHQQTFQDLKKYYIDTGKARFFVVNLPGESHENALLAAESGRCAADQKLFWAMHARLQSVPERLGLAQPLAPPSHWAVPLSQIAASFFAR